MSNETTGTPFKLDRSPASIKVDNLLRQQLKVSDPYDAAQIAQGLMARYADDAGQLERERRGLPAVRGPSHLGTPAAAAPAFPETDLARDDLEADLRLILTDPSTKDLHPEMRGWARSIRNAAAEGLGSAGLALDPNQRDRAFGARRTLSEYARLSRYVGALSGSLNMMFRRLGQSCDVVANLVLVRCGEALAAGGVMRSSFILQAPVSELQMRRDAALGALRNLVGSTQYAYGPNEWPRGLEAYRQLIGQLDAAGQADLRALFNEAVLGRVFDEMIDMAAGNTPDGLRALGATAMVTLGQINRLIAFSQRAGFLGGALVGPISPESPPLASFLSALSLFVEGFKGANRGFRLVYIARPPLLSYGLYGTQGIDDETQRLLNLILLRNRMAEQIDCVMRCDCNDNTVRQQLQLDKLLFDVDRAIDYYALGVNDPSGGEVRALAYGALITAFTRLPGVVPLSGILPQVSDVLGWRGDIPELVTELGRVVGNLAEVNNIDQAVDLDINHTDGSGLDWSERVASAAHAAVGAANAGSPLDQISALTVMTLNTRRLYGELLHQELYLQETIESQWEELVRALTPRCITPQMIRDRGSSVITDLLYAAHDVVLGATGVPLGLRPSSNIAIPPNIETAFDAFVNNIRVDGFGRP